MKLAIGPVLFEWGKAALRDFYRRMAQETAADILYLGEVVCSKRNNFDAAELAELGAELVACGKEVVFSTLGLVMDQEEQDELVRITAAARRLGVWVEANDLAGLAAAEGSALVAGPHITTYNAETLHFLAGVGVRRVVVPVELPEPSIAGMALQRREVALEVLAYGKLPLAFSARCYTARSYHLTKATCQYKCQDWSDGMELKTQDGESFLTVNGLETMSCRVYNLAGQVERLREMGVGVVRLSPQSRNMVEIVAVWRDRLDGRLDAQEALRRLSLLNEGAPFCNGYYFGQPGLAWVA